MSILEPPFTHYLAACAGWLELGNTAEATAELNQLPDELQGAPEVIEARWHIAARRQDWEEALIQAQALIRVLPNHSSGWLHQAYALRRCPSGGLTQAWNALLPAHARFPKDATIAYNLSCYACQLAKPDLALTWFHRAIEIGGKEAMKKMALLDQDLEPLWEVIRNL